MTSNHTSLSAEAGEWLVSALVSKDQAGTTIYGHRAAIITANGESDAKGQALDKFLVGSYRLESIYLKPLTRPDLDLVKELVDALGAAREWLSGWASAEPYINKIDTALAKAKERGHG